MLVIDYRENELCKELDARNVSYTKENLPIGDIHIVDSNGVLNIIIERKTVDDLAASLCDGRYEEQSYRLNDASLPNHNIIYLIEGDIRRSRRIPPDTLYSTITSLMLFKGFNVFSTKDSKETAQFLNAMDKKITRNAGTIKIEKNYVSTLRKKKYYTETTVSESMLCQIPGVSHTIAKALIQKYGNIRGIIDATDLEEFKHGNKPKKISKTIIENIKQTFDIQSTTRDNI